MFWKQDHKKNDLSKILGILAIFTSISFLVLTTFGGKYDFSYHIFDLRQWQYLLAVFSGGALGVAGLLLQKLTKNILSDVSILGIGSLNIIFIIFYLLATFTGDIAQLTSIKVCLTIISIASSILGTGLIYYFSQKKKNNRQNFIIVGISLQFLFEAINMAVLSLVNKEDESVNNKITTEIGNYSYGRFGNIAEFSTYSSWRIITVICFFAIVVICYIVSLFSKQLDMIEINEELAKTNNVCVDKVKIFLYLCVALLAGIESALVGTISLLGIIAPNVSKFIFGNRSRINIFSSFFIGAILVLGATWISVNLGQNIPIGILSTAIVAPFFMYLIFFKN